MKNILKYKPTFYVKGGHWGEQGWIEIAYWKWLCLWLTSVYVIKTEWTKRN